MRSKAFGSYEQLAQEYYDAVRHPTCANFREASRYLLRQWLRTVSLDRGWICEVGAGRSLFAELVCNRTSLQRLLLVDSSPSMLTYSVEWAACGATLVLGDARSLPVQDQSIDTLISSLGDAYNEPDLWSEIERVLCPGGTAFFTSPSYEWAAAFREKGSETAAEFVLSDGRQVWVPSYIYPEERQVKLIECSRLIVKEVTHAPISVLLGQLSRKLDPLPAQNAKVVTAYVAVKG